jgi:sugar phosphate isomerase/epimerase
LSSWARRGGAAPYPELFAHARSCFADIAPRAAGHGVKVLVELHRQTVVASSSAALRLLEGVDPAAVGVIHDLGFGNLVIEGGEDVRAGLEMLGPTWRTCTSRTARGDRWRRR